jgi:hypothetical protein
MTFNQSTLVEYKTTAGTVSASTVTKSGGTVIPYDTTVAAGATNVHAVVAVDVSQLVSFVLFSSQTVTMKTNSSSVPEQIFTLVGGVGQTWNSSRTDANPLTADISDLYFSNSGTAAATVNLRFLFS